MAQWLFAPIVSLGLIIMQLLDGPRVLIPFHRAEAITAAEAAAIAKRTPRTIREWCLLHDLGRRVGGRWAVSIVALHMFLDGATAALATYLKGDRCSPPVAAYFERYSVPLPRPTPTYFPSLSMRED